LSKRPQNKRSKKWLAVERFLLLNPRHRNEDVVKACQVSMRLVTSVRAVLRTEGRVPPSFGDWTSTAGPPKATPRPATPAAPDDDPEALIASGTAELLTKAANAEAEAGHEFSIEEQLRLCRRFANSRVESPQVRLAALAMYNKIKSELGARDQLGPGRPLTDDDRITRLSLLCEAVGLRIASFAFERAFGRKEQPDAAALAPDPPHPVPDPDPAPRHDDQLVATPGGPREGEVEPEPGPLTD